MRSHFRRREATGDGAGDNDFLFYFSHELPRLARGQLSQSISPVARANGFVPPSYLSGEYKFYCVIIQIVLQFKLSGGGEASSGWGDTIVPFSKNIDFVAYHPLDDRPGFKFAMQESG